VIVCDVCDCNVVIEMVGQMALGVAGVARGTLPYRQPVPGDETQGVLSGCRATRLPSVVRQVTGTARISSSGQHGVRGEASSGAVSYPLQRERPADVPVLERDDFVPVQATDDVRLWTNAQRACLRSSYDE